MKKLLVILLLFSIGLNAQDKFNNEVHYYGSGALTSITYLVPRNGFDLDGWTSAGISFTLNEIVGQLIEHGKNNVFDHDDLWENRKGTLTVILLYEVIKLSRILEKKKDPEINIIQVNTQLVTMFQPQKPILTYSTELRQ